MSAGRTFFAALDLLDRQLRDRDDVECGNVDDLELTSGEDGTLYVTAIIAGPGALAYRLGARRLGAWLRRAYRLAGSPDDTDRTRIPIELAHRIASSIDLAVDRHDLATLAVERWLGDHVIGHIPGNHHDVDE
jgi:hypothetical protein